MISAADRARPARDARSMCLQMIHMMVWYALRQHTLWWDWRFGGAFVVCGLSSVCPLLYCWMHFVPAKAKDLLQVKSS